MKRYSAFPPLLALFAGHALAQVNAPCSGFVRFGALPIQTVYGVPGNLVPGPTTLGSATVISFSDVGGLLARSGTIKLIRGDGSTIASYDMPETAPILSVGKDLTTAVAWLPSAHTLLWSDGKTFSTATMDDGAFAGQVTSVSRVAPKSVRFLIANADGSASAVKISLPGGDVISSDLLPGVRGPAFFFDSEIFWVDREGLEIENANGVRRTLPLASSTGDLNAEQMSSHWIHLFSTSGGPHWALRLGDTPPVLSRLPVPAATRVGQNLAIAEAAK